MIAITSFSQKGYETYGKKFLDSAVKHFPGQIIVYYEEKPDFEHEKVIYKPLYDIFGLNAFLQYCDANPIFHGQTGSGYSYNYNAYTFAKKAFSQFDALQHYNGKIFWIDADCVIQKDIPKDFLEGLFNFTVFDDQYSSSIVAMQRDGLYTETGFVGFDNDKPVMQEFLKIYMNVYRKGILFTLRGWHDCYALDKAIEQSGVSVKNLSPDFPEHGINVMPHTVLGPYIVHNKGNRKHAVQRKEG